MKSRLLKIIITLIISVCVLVNVPFAVLADGNSDILDLTSINGRAAPPSTDATAVILVEANTGAILYSKNADSTYYPASITKVMTALLVLENCELDETVTFSYRATHELEEGSSSIARTEGEEMSVEECLYAMLIASANEVAQALAEHVGGTIEQFAEMMTARAKELGCKNTRFANPSGLNNPDHYTTCYDMALIMREALSIPKFVEIDSSPTHVVPATNKHSESLGIAMKHNLIKKGDEHYEYIQCGKTGYTSIAGYTLVSSAKKGSMNLICVTLGCKDSASRYTTTRALFDYGFDNFTMYDIAQNDVDFRSNEMLTDNGFLGSNLVSLSMPENNYVILPNGVSFDQLESSIKWHEDGDEGSDIATIAYSYDNVVVGSVPLTIAEDKDTTYDFLRDNTTLPAEYEKDVLESIEAAEENASFDSTLLIIIATVISFLLILVIILLIVKIKQTRRRNKRKRRYGSHRRSSKYSSKF